MQKYHTAWFNYLVFELPMGCVLDCSRQGSVDEAVEHWQSVLNLKLDRDSMIKELLEYGNWNDEDLNEMDNLELEKKMIWIGSCNILEEIKP